MKRNSQKKLLQKMEMNKSKIFKNLAELYQFLDWNLDENLNLAQESFPIFIPEKLAKKIKLQGPDGILAKEFLPRSEETFEAYQKKVLLIPSEIKISQKRLNSFIATEIELFLLPQMFVRFTAGTALEEMN